MEQGLFHVHKKDVVPTVQFVHAQARDEEEGEAADLVIRPCPTRKRATKYDPKGKSVASFPEKAKKDSSSLNQWGSKEKEEILI